MLAVTDTHALVWAVTGKMQKLGRQARRQFEQAQAGQAAIYVPTFVLVELSELTHLGRVTLFTPFDAWATQLVRSRTFIVHDLTPDVVRHAHNLFAIPERSDRLIAATAVALGLPLMTRDPAIAQCAGVERLWD